MHGQYWGEKKKKIRVVRNNVIDQKKMGQKF